MERENGLLERDNDKLEQKVEELEKRWKQEKKRVEELERKWDEEKRQMTLINQLLRSQVGNRPSTAPSWYVIKTVDDDCLQSMSLSSIAHKNVPALPPSYHLLQKDTKTDLCLCL